MSDDIRPGVHPFRRRPPTAAEVVAALIHEWCGRPHDLCWCQDNPLRRPAVAAVHREKAEMVRRAQRSAA